jgi:hypothetical protein
MGGWRDPSIAAVSLQGPCHSPKAIPKKNGKGGHLEKASVSPGMAFAKAHAAHPAAPEAKAFQKLRASRKRFLPSAMPRQRLSKFTAKLANRMVPKFIFSPLSDKPPLLQYGGQGQTVREFAKGGEKLPLWKPAPSQPGPPMR